MSSSGESPSICLALSGGGLRATLFHLGVLQAFREAGKLRQVTHICSVSGGSVLAAHLLLNWEMYAGSPESFDQIARKVRELTSRDLRNRILRRWIGSLFMRSRTALFQDELHSFFEKRTMKDLRRDGCELYMLGCSMTTGELCSFSPDRLEFETTFDDAAKSVAIDSEPVAKAVAASAAFPPMFPPQEISKKTIPGFSSKVVHYVTDGGVYDNLGIKMFELLRRKQGNSEMELWVSDAEARAKEDLGRTFRFVFPRSVRANELLMERVTILTRQLGIAPDKDRFVSLSEPQPIEPVARTKPEKLKNISILPQLQGALRSVRTDIDGFSPKLANTLIRHGYEQASIALGHPLSPPPESPHLLTPNEAEQEANRRWWRFFLGADPAVALVWFWPLLILFSAALYDNARKSQVSEALARAGTATEERNRAVQLADLGARSVAADLRVRHSTLRPGLSVWHKSSENQTGSICCVVRSRSQVDRYSVLSAAQVFDGEQNGCIQQPALNDSVMNSRCVATPGRSISIGVAAASLNAGTKVSNFVAGIGKPLAGIADRVDAGQPVVVFGSASGGKEAHISRTDGVCNLPALRRDRSRKGARNVATGLIEIEGLDPRAVDWGDLGAPVITREGNLVGMIVCESNGKTYAAPIQQVLKELDVELVTASQYHGACNASAIVAVENQHFLAGEDDHNIVRKFEAGNSKAISVINLDSQLETERSKSGTPKEADIEAAAATQAGPVFWIGSHGLDRKDNPEPSRRRFFQTNREGQFLGEYASNLLPMIQRVLSQHLPDKADPDDVEIEGMSVLDDTKPTLLLGLRKPLDRLGHAIFLQLRNPLEVLAHAEPVIHRVQWNSDFGRLGVRAIESVRNSDGIQIYVLAGPTGKHPGDARLYHFDSKGVRHEWNLPFGAELEGVLEGLMYMNGRLYASRDADQVGVPLCRDLLNADDRHFTVIDLGEFPPKDSARR
ncbi:MAG: patatin-like phospholipase family protein [Bryobacterales bacterium]|nr:patatin-like phospholipase family protein [Bryobacterales bacterium]